MPEQSKDEVRPSLHDVLGSNIDDVTSDGASRVEGQCLVLLHCEHIQLALVDGSLINSVGDRGVDQLAVGMCACVCVREFMCVCKHSGSFNRKKNYHRLVFTCEDHCTPPPTCTSVLTTCTCMLEALNHSTSGTSLSQTCILTIIFTTTTCSYNIHMPCTLLLLQCTTAKQCIHQHIHNQYMHTYTYTVDYTCS